MDIAYVVPTVRGGDTLHQCLEAIRVQTLPPRSVVVVANGVRLPTLPGEIRTLTLPRNAGYAPACNLGIESTREAFIAFVNDDAILPPTWAEDLARHFTEGDPTAAATGIAVAAGNGERCAGSKWNERWQAVETPDPDEAAFLNFTAVLFSRDALTAAGGFPAPFFAYYEDVDLSLTLSAMGRNTHVDPDVEVIHLVSLSAPLLGAKRWFYLLRNRYWTLCRHYGKGFVLARLPLLVRSDFPLWRRLLTRPHLIVKAYASIPFYPKVRHA